MLADRSIFLNTNELAEEVTYNGAPIIAVLERGQTLANGNIVSEGDGTSDRAVILVSESDVSNPSSRDTFTDASGKVWRFGRILASGGGMHRIELTANESPGWRR
jgi:hypothetical protein